MVLRLSEDGYVSYEDGVVEIGLLRDCGNAVVVKQFEDGTVYIYNTSACNNGVYARNLPVVYRDMDYPVATATVGSILLMLAEGIRGT